MNNKQHNCYCKRKFTTAIIGVLSSVKIIIFGSNSFNNNSFNNLISYIIMHYVKKREKVGAKHFIYNMNRLTTTKVDSIYLGC